MVASLQTGELVYRVLGAVLFPGAGSLATPGLFAELTMVKTEISSTFSYAA